MKVKQACRRDRPGGEPQCKGCAPANRGQSKESSVCFSSISIAKLSISFELCKACAVFLSICLLISIFPRAEPEYVCCPSAQGEGGELQWREDGATKRDWREKRGAVRENAEQNRNTPAGRFISSPLFSYRCCRDMCCVRPKSTPCAPIAHARTPASAVFHFLPSLLHPNATFCCE